MKIKICKSTNETTNMRIKYPIKFGRVGRSAIWGEKEILELLLGWEFIKKTTAKSSYFITDETLSEYLGEVIQMQGMAAWYSKVEVDEELFKKLSKFVDLNIIDT